MVSSLGVKNHEYPPYSWIMSAKVLTSKEIEAIDKSCSHNIIESLQYTRNGPMSSCILGLNFSIWSHHANGDIQMLQRKKVRLKRVEICPIPTGQSWAESDQKPPNCGACLSNGTSGTYNCFISPGLKTRGNWTRRNWVSCHCPNDSRGANQTLMFQSWTCILIPKCYFFPIMRLTFPLIKIPLQT